MRLPVLVLFATIAGCQCTPPTDNDGGSGGGAAGGAGGGGQLLDVVGQCSDYVNDYCTFLGRCSQVDVAECKVGFASLCANLGISVQRGTATFSGDELLRCRQSLSPTSTCGLPPVDCSPGIAKVAQGGACLVPTDCLPIGENFTAPTCGSTAGCPSTCAPGGTSGLPCSYGGYCAEGLRCDRATNTCGTALALGAPCNPDLFPGECATDLRCDSVGKTCVGLPRAGQPCPSFVCSSGSSCVGSTCLADAASGQACGGATSPQCGAGLTCRGSVCGALGQSGEPCDDVSQCADGLACSFGQCTVALPLGARCEGTGSECRNGVCDAVLQQCVNSVPQNAGAPCGDAVTCAAPLACVGLTPVSDGGIAAPGSCGSTAVGSACYRAVNAPQCPVDTACLLVDGGFGPDLGTCSVPPLGGGCSRPEDCRASQSCDFAQQHCVASATEGMSCVSTGCVPGLECRGGVGGSVCVRIGTLGQSCGAGGACQEGLVCLANVCRIIGFPGAPCVGNSCIIGVCNADAGTCSRPIASGACNADTECESQRCREHQCQATCN